MNHRQLSQGEYAVRAAGFGQVWTAAARDDAAGVADAIDQLAAAGMPDAAAEARAAMFLHGRAAWTTAGFAEPTGFRDVADGVVCQLTGTVVARLPLMTFQNRPHMRLVLVCDDGAVLVHVPPLTYERYGYHIARGEGVIVAGRVDRRDVRPTLMALQIDEVPGP